MKTPSLAVALVQADLYWESPTANRAALEEKIAELPEPADVIVLPELFTTGFSMNAAALAEPMNLTTTRWLRQIAAQTQALVLGSVIIQEEGYFYNRLLAVYPDGTCRTYDKRHLFRMGQEHQTYTPGTRRLLLEWKGWRLCPLICYDLRFPVWSRNDPESTYDLLLYVANWPAPRAYAWNTLLRARAIENQSYVVGVNRTGTDGNDWPYAGGSLAVDFLGEVITDLGEAEAARVVHFSKEALEAFRKDFPALLDADAFDYASP
ncbi:amidohydrolase [Rhabdobacter roseus]|uniref:Omega-amidase YafV n=1 Tax=Rhabdobacter roseus TaxID=1655419 RepID=A0A840TTU5_9BACT|nr:amidohydrolase [Rhabdobacter roseus]MBB5286694.1 putative amidohydrolase [Rhabdobacter roseus]